MTKLSVFPIIRQARFQPKRIAMKYVYYTSVAQEPDRAGQILADAEAAVDATLKGEGVPTSERRAAIASYLRDLGALIRANGGDCPERSVR